MVFTPATRRPFTKRSCAVLKFLSTRPFACVRAPRSRQFPTPAWRVQSASAASPQDPGLLPARPVCASPPSGRYWPCPCKTPEASRTLSRITPHSSLMFCSVVSVPHEPRKQPAGGVVDHGDQIQLLSCPSSQSCSLWYPTAPVSPKRVPPRPPDVYGPHLLPLAAISFARGLTSTARKVSLLTSMSCLSARYSAARVGPNPLSPNPPIRSVSLPLRLTC